MTKRKLLLYHSGIFFVFFSFMSVIIQTIGISKIAAQTTQTVYSSPLDGTHQVPPNSSPGIGSITVTLLPDGKTAEINLSFSKLLGPEINAHLHGPAVPGDTNAILIIIPVGSPINNYITTLSPQQIQWLQSGLVYSDIHSTIYPDGEIRGQLLSQTTTSLTPTTAVFSGTPIPTLSPSQIPIGHTVFSVSVCLHGLGNCGDNTNPNSGGNSNPQHMQRSMTITVLNTTGQVVMTQPGTVTYNSAAALFTGTIDMGTLAAGNYIVKEKVDGFLNTQIPGILSVSAGTTSILPTIRAITGDINNDNQVDILDYNDILNCYGTKQHTQLCMTPPNTQSSGADINDDGQINGTDYNLFLRELSLQRGA